MNKLTRLIIISAITVSLTGCSALTSKSNIEQSRNTDISRIVTISNIDDYKSYTLNLIKTGETNNIFIEDFLFSQDDIISDANVINSYIFNNAIYLQINDKFMYRFQLNSDKLVESYIRYQLEG